jgi:hypothetical protein
LRTNHPFFANYPQGEVAFDFSVELSTFYCDVPWIVQYFVHSTFPAMFCNFISDEYLAIGYRFLEAHIADRLISQLVGVYLLHSFLFRDRLLECFTRLSLSLRDCASEEELLEVFVGSVSSCASHLSSYHIRILRLLSEKSPIAAVSAVCYFLSETVKKWRHAPLLSELRILTRRRLPIAPIVQPSDLQYDFLLLPRLRRLADDASLSGRLLAIHTDDSQASEMPCVHQIVYFEGIEFCLSVLDLDIMIHLFGLLCNPEMNRNQFTPSPSDPSIVMTNAFTIRVRSRHYPTAPTGMPVPTERSHELTLLKLQESKAIHDSLLSISRHIHLLQNVHNSAGNLLILSNRSIAASLVKVHASRKATSDFAARQRMAYSLHIFSTFVKSPLLEYVTGLTAGGFETVHGHLIGREIRNASARGRSLPMCLVDATIDYVNGPKDDFTADFPDNPQRHCKVQGEIEYPLAEAFVNAAGWLGFALAMEKTSWNRISLLGQIESQFGNQSTSVAVLKTQALTSLLRMNTSDGSPFRRRSGSQTNLDLVATAEDVAELKHVLQRFDSALMRSLEDGVEQVGSGNRVFAFLEIEKFMGGVFEWSEIGDGERCQEFLMALFDGRDPMCLRGFLLRLLVLIRDFGDAMRSLGELVSESVTSAFENLRSWFGFVDMKALRGEL